MQSIKTIFRVWRQYAKMDLLWLLRDTRYCLLYFFTDAVEAVASVSAVLLISQRFGGLGGMTFDELLFLCGYAVLTDGIIMLFFSGSNVSYISRIIGRGQLDHMLIQPVPLWAQMLTDGFVPFSGGSKLLCGIALTAAAVGRLGLSVTPVWLCVLLFSLLCSVVLILSVVFVVSGTAFYAPAAAEEIAGVVHELFSGTKYYPLSGLAKKSAAAFCSVIPVGLAAWFPAGTLLGKTPAGLPAALLPASAAVWAAAAIFIFKKGMHHYEKYGSNRYSGFGHR